MTVDDLFRDICVEAPAPQPYSVAAAALRSEPSAKAMDEEVWRELAAAAAASGRGGDASACGGVGSSVEVTLEDFLARTGGAEAEEEEEEATAAAASVSSGQQGDFACDPVMGQRIGAIDSLGVVGFGGVEGCGEVGRGRGTKRMLMDPLDKAALQRQKRMIKNRESAARSREKKQAYTAELEALVARLEEENAQLIRAQEEHQQRRLNQLLATPIPVSEMKKPRQRFRRACSVEW